MTDADDRATPDGDPASDGRPTAVEALLADAFAAARREVAPHEDLFTRIELSLDDARERRRFRLRLAVGVGAGLAILALVTIVLSALDSGRSAVSWWVIELITNIVLVALVVGLGPFIKRFGRAYAADVFRATPRTGKSYLVLTDVAYYLIFTSYILFTLTLLEPFDWRWSTTAQLQDEARRVGGMLLLMGVLHGLNVAALPVVGRLLRGGRSDAT
jgi:hypothetical protein